jgi:hypothetical protein
MEQSTLAEQWADNNHRLQWIVDVREELERHTDLNESIPRRKSELDAFLDRYKATISRQLNESGETDNTTGDKEGDS